ncbi:hypothetical protein IW15_14090 [Chryseobacterium soli]|uniref:Cyclic-phosphate processing Receiver domain-containing protein n=1 Tax=Chryseobacterium soli TaxID=445961 RepID=A0A086A558_9FLAO|nr:cyclic-phosphate processing receiver domain-containing protein [Chryseobacterium soli]KFF11822.1 hypothetical protein IW15_14090 [Chryseobacterium soli]
MELTKRLLFLDDIRYPHELYRYTKQDIFLRNDWYIVRDYEEFITRITEKELPEWISFDHDLAYQHYLKPDSSDYTERTGSDCAKWLVEYCLENHTDLPEFYCHSINPVGKEDILSLLENFKKLKNE